MKRILNKLKNRQGVTILFALLVFLLCILAGTAALTAAASNAGRYTHLESDQQKYLSISSAADLLRGELSDQGFKAEIKYVETYEWWYEPVEETESSEGSDPPDESESAEEEETVEYILQEKTSYELTEPVYEYEVNDAWEKSEEVSSMFKTLMDDYLKSKFFNEVVPEEWYTNAKEHSKTGSSLPDKPDAVSNLSRKLSVNGTDGLENKLSPVTADLKVQEGGYALTLEMGAVDPESSGGSGGGGSGDAAKLLYAASMQIPAATEKSSETDVVVTIEEEEGGESTPADPAGPPSPTPGDGHEKEKGTRTTTTTLVFTVKWDANDVKITRIKGGTTDGA